MRVRPNDDAKRTLEAKLASQQGPQSSKDFAATAVREYLQALGLQISGEDITRPWGGFFRVGQECGDRFIDYFFPRQHAELHEAGLELSCKILLVQPGQRLSWQWHERRAELWRVVVGPVGCMLSRTDRQPSSCVPCLQNSSLQIPATMRHRLIGLDGWGVVAEIWQHVVPGNPSDENDIRRVSDDYSRT